MSSILRPRLWLVSLVVALLVGTGLGYWLHGSPAPTPTVEAAAAVARARVAEAHAAVAIAKPANDAALTALAQYHAKRQRDTVVVDSIVYVPAAAADHVVAACADAIPKDTIAIARQDTAVHAEQVVVLAQDATRPSRLGISLAGLYSVTTRTPLARAETAIRITRRLSLVAEAERGVMPRDSLQLRAGARWTF